jgi:hypothetical protein
VRWPAVGAIGNMASAAAAAMADGGELDAGCFPPRPGTRLLYRRGGLPLRPRLTEAGAGSNTSAGTLGRGRARTDWWVLRCAAVDERESPTWRTGLQGRPWCAQCLGKARCLGQRAARTARQARLGRGARAARDVAARCGVGRPNFVSLQYYSSAQNSKNLNRSSPSGE